MAKKKKNQTREGPAEAPTKEALFTEAGAAQGAAAANQTQNQMPQDVRELIRSTLTVIIAQRKTYALAATLTSIVRAVSKSLDRYLKFIPKDAVRNFIKEELMASGYPVFKGLVEYGNTYYRADVVMLYKDYQEIIEMVKAGRTSGLIRSVIVADGIDPGYDEMVESGYV
jgi:hypothetical protein